MQLEDLFMQALAANSILGESELVCQLVNPIYQQFCLERYLQSILSVFFPGAS